jgi:hypothetical protein
MEKEGISLICACKNRTKALKVSLASFLITLAKIFCLFNSYFTFSCFSAIPCNVRN